jgi:hypothetical protein
MPYIMLRDFFLWHLYLLNAVYFLSYLTFPPFFLLVCCIFWSHTCLDFSAVDMVWIQARPVCLNSIWWLQEDRPRFLCWHCVCVCVCVRVCVFKLHSVVFDFTFLVVEINTWITFSLHNAMQIILFLSSVVRTEMNQLMGYHVTKAVLYFLMNSCLLIMKLCNIKLWWSVLLLLALLATLPWVHCKIWIFRILTLISVFFLYICIIWYKYAFNVISQ